MSSACLLKHCLITPSRAEFSEERSHFLQFSILYCTLLIFHQWEYNCGVSPARVRSSQPSSPCSGLCLSPPWRSAQPPPPPWSATTAQTGPSLSRAPATTSPPSQSTGSRLRRWVNRLLLGQSRKKCTSVSPPARFGKTTGSHPKVPLKIFLYWSDCEDINC